MSHDINLIPPSRLAARRARRLASRWVAGLAVYVMVLTGGVIGVRICVGEPAGVRHADVTRVEHRIEQAREGVSTHEATLSDLEHRLHVAERVGLHPNWSVLQSMVAIELREELVLERVELVPSARRERSAPPTLVLAGYAPRHTQVSDYVLRLEKTQVFERIRQETRRARQGIAGADAVWFELRCVLSTEVSQDGGAK